MQRFHNEWALMVRRWRVEWEAHGRDFGNCHCGRGMGTMRKHRPFEGHASGQCGVCARERFGRRLDRRRARRVAALAVARELASLYGEASLTR